MSVGEHLARFTFGLSVLGIILLLYALLNAVPSQVFLIFTVICAAYILGWILLEYTKQLFNYKEGGEQNEE